MKFLKPFLIFLVLNFGALGLGSSLMGNGPQSTWYTSLDKAPWTPPGWVFGAAWTTIMISFSIYMSFLYLKKPTLVVLGLFVFQCILNISWNYIFFNQHMIAIGLAIIVSLTLVVGVFMILYKQTLKSRTIFILSYFIWLCIATSLNAYILLNN